MLILIALLVVASMSLVFWSLQPDRAKRIIQQRVYSELASEAKRPRRPWMRWCEPLVRLNRWLHVDRHRGYLEARFIAGRVALTQSGFLVIKEVCAALAVLVYLFVKEFQGVQPQWLLLWAAVGFLLPDVWLKQRIASRRGSVAQDLPEVVELLTLCVDAGADFMNSLHRVVREYRRCPLRDELALLLQEVSVGKRRPEAFRSLANRLRVPEVNAFARTIIHADRMGTGMIQALRIMSEDLRLRRYHQAERFAQRAPLKMLLPLILVMLSVLLIVAGPVMLQFFSGDLFPKL